MSLSAARLDEIKRLKKIAGQTSFETRKKHNLSEEDVMVLCKYLEGDILDDNELERLLPLVSAIKGMMTSPVSAPFYFGGVGLEISSDWSCIRSRIAVDEGAAHMFVCIPVAERGKATQRAIENSPYMYRNLISVKIGYGMDIEISWNGGSRVDFIIYEPTPQAKAMQKLSEEDSFILTLIKEKHLKDPDEWRRVLFI